MGAFRTCTGGQMIADHRAQATAWLNVLRAGTSAHKNAITQMELHLGKARPRLALSDIGTSDAEIRRLQVSCCKRAAEGVLYRLRGGTCLMREPTVSRRDFSIGTIRADPTYFDWLQEELKSGGLTLAQVGSSQGELASLRKRDEEAVKRLTVGRPVGDTFAPWG